MTGPWTWHGGDLAAARAQFGEGDRPWLDLSTGVNPHAWPGATRLTIDWRRLPEGGDLRALEAAAARHFGVDPAHVCALPGTEIGLRLVGELLSGPTRYLVPCYRTHGEMAAGALPLAAEAVEAADGATLILANPNNPDGRILERPVLHDLLARRGRDAWLVIDEAFADATPGLSLAPEIGDDRRLILFRSFGKFFGLAGLRLGFVLGPGAVLARIRRKLGAWPVSAGAIAIGAAAYRDADWIAGMRASLTVEAQKLDAMLSRLGHRAVGACPLFRLITVADAMALFERLARKAILTRPFDDYPQWLRIGLPGSEEALARLEAALRDG